MIAPQPFSPIYPNITTYYLNSPNFKGTEYLFYSDEPALYAMLLRKNIDDPTIYDIVYYSLINGYSNSVNYDYRLDFSNYIKIVHSDIYYLEQIDELVYTSVRKPACDMFLLIDSTNFYANASFSAYIHAKVNRDEYIYASDLVQLPPSGALQYVTYFYNYVFSDYANLLNNVNYDEEIYLNSHFTINIENGSIDYVKLYDINNNLLVTYADIYTSDEDIVVGFYPIVTGTHKVVFNAIYDSTHHVITKYVNGICNKNQYFYFGTNNPIESICFTGKRNLVKDYLKQSLMFGKNMKTYDIKSQDRYIQHTGVMMTEEKLFDLAQSPYLIEISGQSVTYWLINETTFEGYNMKSVSSNNSTLNLIKRNMKQIFTGFSNEYYT